MECISDEERYASNIRCDRSVESCHWNLCTDTEQTKEFNFERFTLYLKLKFLNEFDRRSQSSSGCTDLSLTDDDVLSLTLCRMYGQMDVESDHFKKILCTYREERMEEMAERSEHERHVDGSFDGGDDEWTEVFTTEEIEKFETVHHGGVENNKRLELFILPRCRPESRTGAKRDLPNLYSQIQLPCRESQHTCQVAFGVIPDQLNSVLKAKKIVKTATLRSYDSESNNFPDFLHDQGLWLQQSAEKGPDLIYPSYLQGLITTPMEICWKILHQLKAILSLSSGIVKVQDAIQLHEQLFGFKLNDERLKSWGFNTVEAFIRFLLDHWSHSRIRYVQSNELQLTRSSQQYDLYLIHYKESSIKLIGTDVLSNCSNTNQFETNRKPTDTDTAVVMGQQKTRPCRTQEGIPSGCARSLNQFGQEMLDIKKGRETRCKLACYFSPCFFYVNLHSQVDALEAFQEELREEYLSKQCEGLHVRNPELLTKDLPLVVWDDKDQEFYRASIEEKVEPNLFKMRSLDFGYSLLELKDMRFLSESMTHRLPGQAIPCQLYNVLECANWEESVHDYCNNLLHDADMLTLTFKERFINSERRKVYLVRAARSTSNGKEMDVGAAVNAFMKEQQGRMQDPLVPPPPTAAATPDIHKVSNSRAFNPNYSRPTSQTQPRSSRQAFSHNWASAHPMPSQVEQPGRMKNRPSNSYAVSRGNNLVRPRREEFRPSETSSWAQVTGTKSKARNNPKLYTNTDVEFPPL